MSTSTPSVFCNFAQAQLDPRLRGDDAGSLIPPQSVHSAQRDCRRRAAAPIQYRARGADAKARRAMCTDLAEVLEDGERLQQPKADACEIAGQEQDTGDDQKHAHHLFHGAKVLFEILEKVHKGPNGQRGSQKGQTQSR